MSVNLSAPNPAELFPIAGVRIGVTEAGIRKANRKDLTVVLVDKGASVSGVFTQNRFCAAPVQLCREHLASGAQVRAMLINTGNANAGTGEDGRTRALKTCVALAHHLDISPQEILPFSTGVIMESLPVDRIEAGLAGAPVSYTHLDVYKRQSVCSVACQPPLSPRSALRCAKRRNRDRGRIHWPPHVGPSLERWLAPGGRGQGRCEHPS